MVSLDFLILFFQNIVPAIILQSHNIINKQKSMVPKGKIWMSAIIVKY